MDTLADRIQIGTQFLDEVRPGWAGQINLDHLDLSDPYSCVLGQVFEQEGRESYMSGFTKGGFILHDWLVAKGMYEDDEIANAPELAGFERLGIHEEAWSNDEYGTMQNEWHGIVLERTID